MTSALTHASGIRRRTTPRVRRRLPRRLITLALAEDHRTTIGFAALFAIVAYIQPVAYRNAYATLAERLAFARSFAGNKALLMFYGEPHDLLTVGGYSAWRVGGTLALFAGGWGLLAATGRLRGEEESGRTEIVLSTVVSRGTGYAAALSAIGVEALTLFEFKRALSLYGIEVTALLADRRCFGARIKHNTLRGDGRIVCETKRRRFYRGDANAASALVGRP